MPAAFSSPRSGAPLTTKSLRNADLGRLEEVLDGGEEQLGDAGGGEEETRAARV